MIYEFDLSQSPFKRNVTVPTKADYTIYQETRLVVLHFVKDHLCRKVLWGNNSKTLGKKLKLDQTSHRLTEIRTRWGKTVGIMTYYKSFQGLGL